MTPNEQKKAAAEFAARWKDQGYEKGQSQQFWMDLLVSVFGVQDIKGFIEYNVDENGCIKADFTPVREVPDAEPCVMPGS